MVATAEPKHEPPAFRARRSGADKPITMTLAFLLAMLALVAPSACLLAPAPLPLQRPRLCVDTQRHRRRARPPPANSNRMMAPVLSRRGISSTRFLFSARVFGESDVSAQKSSSEVVSSLDDKGVWIASDAAGFSGIELIEDEISAISSELLAVDAKLKSLKIEKGALRKRQTELTNIYDEVRFEVKNARMNGPIIALGFAAALISLLWTDVLAASALLQNDSFMDADWFPEALKLFGRLPMDCLQKYSLAVVAAPVLTKALTSCVSYLGGDLTAQLVEGRRRVGLLDLTRTARNGLLGFFLHGPVLHYWIQFLETGPLLNILPNGGPALLVLKIALDQTFFAVFINLAYATLDGLLSDMSSSDAFARAREVLVPSVVQSWKFWPLVHLVSYSPLIPVDLKLLWIDFMEIVWVAILSWVVNNGKASGGGGVNGGFDEDAGAGVAFSTRNFDESKVRNVELFGCSDVEY